MSTFIIIFLLVYGGVHAVFFKRLSLSFGFKGWMIVSIIVFLVLMVLSPMISRILEVRGNDPAARMFAFVGYVWMGFIFYAFLGSLLLYLFDFVLWIGRFIYSGIPVFSPRNQMIGLIGLIFIILAYGTYEALNLKVEKIVVKTSKLPDHVDSFRVVQISDVHLGIINRDRLIGDIVEKVLELKPDMFVCTGDIVDGSMVNLMHLSDLFRKVDPPYGRFAVLGNHEYYVGLKHSVSFMEHAGFKVLRQEVETVENVINVAGIDDGGRNHVIDASKTLSGVENSLFTLYLVHRPDLSQASQGLYDLQLAGHTHDGQLFPFNFLVRLQFPLLKGLHELSGQSKIYINRGTGTWGPPIRVMSPPEITVVDITRSDG